MSPYWISLALSLAGALATLAMIWGYTKKTVESVEKNAEKHDSKLEALHTAFTSFREEVRVRFAFDEASRTRVEAAGRAPRSRPTPPSENAATGRPRAPKRKRGV